METKNSKREKMSQSNVILETITKKFKNIQWKKIEDKHHPGLTIVHLRYLGKNVDGKWRFIVKVQDHNHPASPSEAHLMHSCLDEIQFESLLLLKLARGLVQSFLNCNKAQILQLIQCRSYFFK